MVCDLQNPVVPIPPTYWTRRPLSAISGEGGKRGILQRHSGIWDAISAKNSRFRRCFPIYGANINLAETKITELIAILTAFLGSVDTFYCILTTNLYPHQTTIRHR